MTSRRTMYNTPVTPKLPRPPSAAPLFARRPDAVHILDYLIELGVYLWKRFFRRQSSSGQICSKCGYDLRASAGRCPECGRAFIDSAEHAKNLDRLVD